MEDGVISIKNAEHYKWGQDCDGWHLLKNDELSVIEECMAPASFDQKHYHRKAQQLFYILKGEAAFEMNGQMHTIHPGESIHVSPGVPHSISNKGTELLRFIVISAPKSHGDRVDIE